MKARLFLAFMLILVVNTTGFGANLLKTPGFEPYPYTGSIMPGPGNVVYDVHGWDYDFQSGFPIVDTEYGTAIYRGQTPIIRSGTDAVRLYNYDWDTAAKVVGSQSVAVLPNTQYTASIWVATVGKFGPAAGGVATDVAGLAIDFCDADGYTIESDIAVATVTDASSEYRELSVQFTTHSAVFGDITTVRFKFYTVVTADLDMVGVNDDFDAYVVFDDAALIGPRATAVVSGIVRDLDTNEPLDGVTVTSGDEVVTTDESGAYSIQSGVGRLTFSKEGYYDEFRDVSQADVDAGNVSMDMTLASLPQNNLLDNPSFEPAVPGQITSTGDTYDQTFFNWRYRFLGPGANHAVDNEAIAAQYWSGPAMVHSGDQAARLFMFPWPSAAGVFEISQDIAAAPGLFYKASAWVLTTGAFGENIPNDEEAGVVIDILDASRNVTQANYASDLLTDAAASYRRVKCDFTTPAGTSFIRFKLRGVLNHEYLASRIVFDDAALDGMTLYGTIQGYVKDTNNNGIRGATVTFGEFSATTDSAGFYRMTPKAGTDRLTASRAGYCSEQKNNVSALYNQITTVDFVLSPAPVINVLSNASFEPNAVGGQVTAGPGWTGTQYGWDYAAYGLSANNCLDNEGIAANYWGGPAVIHTGDNALRCFQFPAGDPAIVEASQTVSALPLTNYKAGVWVHARGDFGNDPMDSAGFVIDLLDSSGNVISDDLVSQSVNAATGTGMQYLYDAFVTTADTAFIRYTLRSVIAERWEIAHVTYDDAVLGFDPAGEQVSTVAAAKDLSDGTLLQFGGALVSAAFDGFFYVEEPDRSSGIKVISPASVAAGDIVTIVGTILTADGERYIDATLVDVTGSGLSPKPLGMIGRTVDTNAAVGLLVKVWGQVNQVSGNVVYIGDGSQNDVLVTLPGSLTVTEGAYVAITGALGRTNPGAGEVSILHAVDVDIVEE